MDPLSLNFIDLNLANVVFLLAVGFIGGLVSGFIGSGGAFVFTPAMIRLESRALWMNVKALSIVFRGKFLYFLKKAFDQNTLLFP